MPLPENINTLVNDNGEDTQRYSQVAVGRYLVRNQADMFFSVGGKLLRSNPQFREAYDNIRNPLERNANLEVSTANSSEEPEQLASWEAELLNTQVTAGYHAGGVNATPHIRRVVYDGRARYEITIN